MDEQQIHNTRKWIAALRSGGYVQDHESLKTDDGYCCLGVACDIAPPEVGEWTDIGFLTYGVRGLTSTSNTSLSYVMLEWLGMDVSFELELLAANDEGETFDTIADLIEEYLVKEAVDQ